MNTIPLYHPSGHPDASHHVSAPGGYEWWYFDAEDSTSPNGPTQVVGIILDGFVFHPGYLRAWRKWRRRPTRNTPPLPAQFPCAYLAVYQAGRLKAQFMSQYPAGSLHSATDNLDLELGPNRVQKDNGQIHLTLSGVPWILTARGPRTLIGQTLSARLVFTPRTPDTPHQRPFLSRQMTGAEHHWVIANPLCSVEGTIRLPGVENGNEGQTIGFLGQGYHDHNFGTGPLGPGLSRWFWGRVLLEDRALTFHYAQPRRRALPVESHLLHASADGIREISTPATIDFWRRSRLFLAYPDRASFGETLELSNPRVIDSAPFYLRLLYDAKAGPQSGTAFCEAAYPHRLLWPILGRMIEMSIHHV